MKNILVSFLVSFFVLISSACTSASNKVPAEGVVNEISQTQFKTLICDYTVKTFSFKGTRPAIVDFSATWCGPCKRLAPILDELATTYKGEIDFYKVDIDESPNVSSVFGINAVPTVMFFPVKGKPTVIQGLYPKDEIVKVINQVFYDK